ncbi:MAG: LolA family protein, partial [Candidatus Bipolaricaulota bacterium]
TKRFPSGMVKIMKHYRSRFVILLLVALIPMLFASPVVLGEGMLRTTDEFIDKLEEEYSKISNFSATLKVSGIEPALTVDVQAITEPRILRVEYVSPEDMKGQFFLLEEDTVWDYRPRPGRKVVIKKELTKSNIPVKAANLTPDYLLELVRSEDLEVNLIGTPGDIFFPGSGQNVLDLGTNLSGLSDPEDGTDKQNSDSGSRSRSGFYYPVVNGEYVLEIIPRTEEYQFARQVIKFNPKDFLPRELITHFADESKDPVYTVVEKVETNLDMDPEEVRKIPENAEVISG